MPTSSATESPTRGSIRYKLSLANLPCFCYNGSTKAPIVDAPVKTTKMPLPISIPIENITLAEAAP